MQGQVFLSQFQATQCIEVGFDALSVRPKAHSCLWVSWTLYQPWQQQPQQGYSWAGLVAKVLFGKLGVSAFEKVIPRSTCMASYMR